MIGADGQAGAPGEFRLNVEHGVHTVYQGQYESDFDGQGQVVARQLHGVTKVYAAASLNLHGHGVDHSYFGAFVLIHSDVSHDDWARMESIK